MSASGVMMMSMKATATRAVRRGANAFAGLLFAASATHAQQPAPAPQPGEMTAQQDHQRTMQLLGMTSIRSGANGNDPKAANAANYDEAKANPYPSIPDVLLTQGRERVTSADTWWKVRRPEIVELFDREVYGRVPANLPAVRWEVKSRIDTVFKDSVHGDWPVVRKELVGHVDNSAYPGITVDILVTLSTPANAKGPVPVILQFSGGGFPPRPPAPAAAPGAPPAAPAAPPRFNFGPPWQPLALAKGWGYATINTASVQRDNGSGLTQGIIGLVNRGQPRSLEDWGVLRAWAWGASKALDYFETDRDVDAKRVGLEGHSRWGKATLVAMAYDPRFAIAYVSSSGEGGAKLHRRNAGEIVENVAGSGEYHWMAGNFLKYAGPLSWDDLPVDAHELIAMCAPRPVFISAGANGDAWVDARGMFMAAVAASPVYELLGKKGLARTEFPKVEEGLMSGDLTFRQHASGHTDTPNWPTFLTFAERYFGVTRSASR
jgi:hypothetical protein